MAILKGFPPSNTISPSVRITEKDLSFIAPEQSFHRAGLVGFASKGPVNIPTIVRSRRQLNTIFGYPHPEAGDPYLIYAAEQYLLVANELYVVRVADTEAVSSERAKIAEVSIPSAGGEVALVGDVNGPFNITKDLYFKWRLNGILSSRTLVVLKKSAHPDPVVVSSGYSAAQLASDLNSQLDPAVDGIEFFSTSETDRLVTAEITGSDNGADATGTYALVNGKIVAGSVTGRVIIDGTVVQTFRVDENDNFFFSYVGSSVPAKRAVSGTIDRAASSGVGEITLTFNEAPAASNHLSVDYRYNDSFGAGVSRLGVRTTFSFGPRASLEFVSVVDQLCGADSIVGLGTGMTPAQMTGSVAGPFNFTTLTDHDLQVVVDGTDSVLVDNVSQVIDLSSLATDSSATVTEVVNAINTKIADLPGGFEAVEVGGYVSLRTLHSGNDARLLVKSDSSLFELLGFDAPLEDPSDAGSDPGSYMTAEGDSPEGVSGDADVAEYGLARGDNNRFGDVSINVMADSPGIEGNGTQVVVRNNVREGHFALEIYNNGVQVESWGNLSKDESSRYYVETFLTLVSDYVRAVDNVSNPSPPLDGVYDLVGGSDGIPSDPDDQDYLLIGNKVGMSGLYSLSEPEQIDLDIVAIPGHSSTGVVLALIDMCQNMRTDCMAIIDAPFGLTVKEVVNWQNGAHPLNTTRFDSDFAALYWPWVKIRDTYNNVDVWVPPSGSIMAVYARNDTLSAPWFAPAGVNRGVVPGITDVFSRPTLEERDLMYGNRNCVNPIVQYADFQDFVVWGQKTLQRRPTALDRVNVRRLMFAIEKRIRSASRALLFEPNDEATRGRFVAVASQILREIQIGRGLTAYVVKADEELNTPAVIDRNELRARIGVQPTRATEFIFIEFSIHRTGSFEAGSDTL